MTELEIEAFLSIVRNGTLSSSAKELFVTQPALSRRLKALETELGYSLIKRGKGKQTVQLTEAGKAFWPVAEKWQYLWAETGTALNLSQRPVVKLASVGSVSTYLLPPVFHIFLEKNPNYNMEFHEYHSKEAYGYAESGLIDMAFVTDPMYSDKVQSIPAFSERYVLISKSKQTMNHKKRIHPTQLCPESEVRLPWSLEYDSWHKNWFDEKIYPKVYLDQMSLMEDFLIGNNWAIVPISVGRKMQEKGCFLYELEEGPGNRIIYYLKRENKKQKMIDDFLNLLHQHLQVQEGMTSLLQLDRL